MKKFWRNLNFWFPEKITAASFGHLTLYKKIKNLPIKLKMAPYIYYLLFGGGWVLMFVYDNFMFVILLSGMGLVFDRINEDFWQTGKGHLVIGASELGILNYMNLYRNQQQPTPLVNWGQIEYLKQIDIDNESYFIIYLKKDLLRYSDINNITVPRIIRRLVQNKIKFGSEIVLNARDFHTNDYMKFVNEFQTMYEKLNTKVSKATALLDDDTDDFFPL